MPITQTLHNIAKTQPTTQRNKKRGWCVIIIGKKMYHTSAALMLYLRSIDAIPPQHWCHTSAALVPYLRSIDAIHPQEWCHTSKPIWTDYNLRNWDSKNQNQTTTTPHMWLNFKPLPGNLGSWCILILTQLEEILGTTSISLKMEDDLFCVK
jgi:hypothetical protein